jgi:hypothetical protein
VRAIVDQIVSLMTVPLVQGSLRYAHKIGMNTDRSQKNAAEGATFTAAVLPLVHACSATSAALISANQKFGLYDQSAYPDFVAVKAAFEATYSCLGITCEQVGALVDSSGEPLHPATAACSTTQLAPVTCGPGTYIGSSNECEISCGGLAPSSDRMLEELDNESWKDTSEDVVDDILAEMDPQVAAALAKMDPKVAAMMTGQMREQMNKLGSLFGQPALA